MSSFFKRRVVGLLAVTALLVIFLPSFFERNSTRVVDTETHIPSPPAVVTLDISEPSKPAGVVPAPLGQEMYQLVEEDEEIEPVEQKDVEQKNVAIDGPVTDNAALDPQLSQDQATHQLDAESIPVAWIVQVASFQKSDRGLALVERLKSEGYDAFIRSAQTSKGVQTRVFIGPQLNSQRAQAIKNSVDKLLGLNSLVKRFQP